MLAKKERPHHCRSSRKGKTCCLSGSAKNTFPLSSGQIGYVVFRVSFWLYTSEWEKELGFGCAEWVLFCRELCCVMSFLTPPAEVSLTTPYSQRSFEELCLCITKLSLAVTSRGGASSKSEDKTLWAETCFFKVIYLMKSIFRLGGCTELYPRKQHTMYLCKELLLQFCNMWPLPSMYHVSLCLHHYIWHC